MTVRSLSSVLLGSILACLPSSAVAQATKPDYARAEQFLSWNIEKRVFQDRIEPHWLDGGHRFWYRVVTRRGAEFNIVDPVRNTRRPVFDNARLAAAMSLAADSAVEGTKLGFTTFEFRDGERQIEFRSGERQFVCDIAAYRCTLGDTLSYRDRTSLKSPDGQWAVFAQGHNLFLQPMAGGDSAQLTIDGDSLQSYGIHPGPLGIQWRTPPTGPPAAAWSPDSRKIAVARTDYRGVQYMPIYSSTSTRPRYWLYHYGLPGDSAIARYDIHIIDVAAGTSVRVEAEQQLSINDVGPVRDSVGAVKWAPGSDRLFFISAARGARRLALMVADANTGEVRRLVSDTATGQAGTLDNPGASSALAAWRLTDSEEDVYWYSTRDGWGHLHRYRPGGSEPTQVTSGPWSLRSVEHADTERGVLYVLANGREPDRFLYHNYLYRVGTDGSGMTLLTPEPANHSVVFSPSGKYFIDTYSRLDQPPVTVLRSASDGRIIRELERADISGLEEMGWEPPEAFRAIAADGVSGIYGIIWKPNDFDATRKYPVIDYIYPVPGANIRSWGFLTGSDPVEPRAMAELGFIVVQIKGRGTRGRSKAFLDAYQGRMGENTLPDHVTAIQQLGARYPWMDLDRVGITGHSGGGYASAAAILRYPDFYKVAVSAAGNHDNRSYGAFWGEKYQGLLTTDSITGRDNFEAEANYTLAGNLKGKLLLTTGDMDDNVHPAHTLRLVHALIEADKKFDLMILPDRGHGLAEPYHHRLRFDYFVRHLMGVEPPEYTFRRPEG